MLVLRGSWSQTHIGNFDTAILARRELGGRLRRRGDEGDIPLELLALTLLRSHDGW